MTASRDVAEMGARLAAWFEGPLHACDAVSAIGSDEAHRRAVLRQMLARNARILVATDIAEADAVARPLIWTLAAACRLLPLTVTDVHWASAVKNVGRLQEQLAALGVNPWVGSAEQVLKELVDGALIDAGVTASPTILDKRNRDIALGLAVNWALRLSVALARGTRSSTEPLRDLGTILAAPELGS